MVGREYILSIPGEGTISWTVGFGSAELNNAASVWGLDAASVGTVIFVDEIGPGHASRGSTEKQGLVGIRHDEYRVFHLHPADVDWEAVTYSQSAMCVGVGASVE